MFEYSVISHITLRQQRTSSGHAQWSLTICAREIDAFGGEAVRVWGGRNRVSCASHYVRAMLIRHHQNYVGSITHRFHTLGASSTTSSAEFVEDSFNNLAVDSIFSLLS